MTSFVADTVAAEVEKRKPAPDRDVFWLTEAKNAQLGIETAIMQLRHARALAADVAHAKSPAELRLAQHREGLARSLAWRAAAAAAAMLTAALADHPFTAEVPPLRRMH